MNPEFAANCRNMMLNFFEMEHQITKRVIAAVPDAKSGYRHDPKGFTAFDLAWHIASAEIGLLMSIMEIKFTPPSQRGWTKPQTIKEILDWYEEKWSGCTAKIKAMTGEQLATVTQFFGAFTAPVVIFLSTTMNHTIHHRGELATYLRPMGSKVPSIYGPSADEAMPPPPAAAQPAGATS